MDVKGDADLIICQSVFEHIPDTQRAVQNLAAMLKPGGKAIIFCPSKYAVFAIINLILPEQLKVSLLSRIYPETLVGYGFKAHYHKCTIGEISQSAKEAGLTVETAIPYYRSSYFHFFLPLHLIWRVWNLFFAIVAKERAAETMTLILSKPNKRSRQ
jgi:SAM-dependent methyltransferase